MAIIHRDGNITPTKRELARAWLDWQGLGAGDVEMLGAYLFDDPAGAVGIEGHLVRRAGEVFHLPMTYRGAPRDGADTHLLAMMEHSVLGRRWVYAAEGDPVAGLLRRRPGRAAGAGQPRGLGGRRPHRAAAAEYGHADRRGRRPGGRRGPVLPRAR